MSLVGTCHEVAKPEVPKPFRQSDSESDPNVARMIHDLRNMLLVVVAHADLACESLAREHPSRRHLENVRSAAQSAAALDDAEFRDAATDPRADASLLTTSEPEREEIAAGPARPGQAGRLSHTILLVEDESLILESSVEFLSGVGFHVMAAADGEEALLEIQRHQGSIDLLITDNVLPNMTGLELAAVVVAAHPETKVLMIPGCPKPEMLASQGPDDFLAKPFSFSVLDSKIRELLQPKKHARSAGAAS